MTTMRRYLAVFVLAFGAAAGFAGARTVPEDGCGCSSMLDQCLSNKSPQYQWSCYRLYDICMSSCNSPG